ncbi:hypothetical protein, partial [Microvirga aerilata]|uniref:hypothetical protein n=1 Tax=Microvirga aerilata TaxID=670292 RepID=UPI001AEEEC86
AARETKKKPAFTLNRHYTAAASLDACRKILFRQTSAKLFSLFLGAGDRLRNLFLNDRGQAYVRSS